MIILGTLIASVLGAIFGSYATLFLYRIPLKESCFGRYFGPKSRCPNCNKIIRTRDLIPIINWYFTRGKCTNCDSKIPVRYLLIEILTSVLFAMCYLQFSFSELFILHALSSFCLLIMIFICYNNMLISKELLYAVLTLSLLTKAIEDYSIINSIFSASFGVIFSAIFYRLFNKKISSILIKKNLLIEYCKFLIIAAIYLDIEYFFYYLIIILIIISIFDFFFKSDKDLSHKLISYFLIIFLFFNILT